jgi:hypothetical protein
MAKQQQQQQHKQQHEGTTRPLLLTAVQQPGVRQQLMTQQCRQHQQPRKLPQLPQQQQQQQGKGWKCASVAPSAGWRSVLTQWVQWWWMQPGAWPQGCHQGALRSRQRAGWERRLWWAQAVGQQRAPGETLLQGMRLGQGQEEQEEAALVLQGSVVMVLLLGAKPTRPSLQVAFQVREAVAAVCLGKWA